MAVGLPIKKEDVKEMTHLYNQNQSIILMAAGQKDVRITKDIVLFPQNAKNKLLAIMFGDYHPALAKSEKALLPPNQLNTKEVDYFIKSDQYHQLKNTSLSVIQGASIILNYCSFQEITHFMDLQKCLKRLSQGQEAKFNQSSLKVKALTL